MIFQVKVKCPPRKASLVRAPGTGRHPGEGAERGRHDEREIGRPGGGAFPLGPSGDRHRSRRVWTCAAQFAAALAILGAMVLLFAEEVTAEDSFRHPSSLDMAAWLPETLPDARIRYADESPLQFGDLRLPDSDAPPSGHPVVIFVHGGGWRAHWTKDYSSPFVEALTRAGYATWDLEFRRIGDIGGGYPGTFLDVAAGADHLKALTEAYPLDLDRVVAVGHSSGGHLALWLAGRINLPASSRLHVADPLPLAGVVSLAGVNDLELSLELGDRTDVLELLGADSRQGAESRFAETNPGRLLPFGIPQALIVGTLDGEWRVAMTRVFAAAARAAGDPVELVVPEGADHFDVVDREGPGFELAVRALRTVLGR